MLECRDIDALMMDWLYQELQPSQSGPFDAHVARCARCQAELEGMKRTRDAVRDLPEVEPPPSITQILLHEAARKAPAAGAVEPAGGGRRGILAWLGDLFTPIAAHPAATALATLVVVAGVAGALYVRGEHRVVEPQADSAAPPPAERAPAPTLLPPAADPAEPVAQAGAAAEAAPPSGDVGIVARLEEDSDLGGFERQQNELEKGKLGATRPGYVATPKEEPPAVGWANKPDEKNAELARELSDEGKKRPAPASRGNYQQGQGQGPAANAVSGADQLVTVDGEADDRARDFKLQTKDVPAGGESTATGGLSAGNLRQGGRSQLGEPAPPPVSPQKAPATIAVDKHSGKQEMKPGTYRVYLQNPADNAFVESKETQLDMALRKNDCATAGRIANDILDRSYEYYVNNVKSRAEKNCKRFVDNEWRSRYAARSRAARAKAAASKGGGGATGGKASQAKPRADDAAESAAPADSN